MEIIRRHEDGVTILELQGRLTAGAGDAQLHNAVREALDAGARNLLIGMAGVSAIDSLGIGELGRAYTSVTRRRGRFGLFALPPTVLGVLKLSRLDDIFEIFGDETEALGSESRFDRRSSSRVQPANLR